ncbi:MAG: FeoA domain-containing protein [Acidobacteriota bacterium]
MGLHPGGVVRLQQNRPSVVLEVGETSVALDREICREIYVLPLLDSS